ncbi:hypothetical protein HDU76_014030 [Blyttiomyces sp. JEL0837]|nr:hypothetical protein HDU76_014030 [Blyttiomyces sp. JEL0837]
MPSDSNRDIRQSRPNLYFEPGVGRKTGFKPLEGVKVDSDGLENPDDFFQSAHQKMEEAEKENDDYMNEQKTKQSDDRNLKSIPVAKRRSDEMPAAPSDSSTRGRAQNFPGSARRTSSVPVVDYVASPRRASSNHPPQQFEDRIVDKTRSLSREAPRSSQRSSRSAEMKEYEAPAASSTSGRANMRDRRQSDYEYDQEELEDEEEDGFVDESAAFRPSTKIMRSPISRVEPTASRSSRRNNDSEAMPARRSNGGVTEEVQRSSNVAGAKGYADRPHAMGPERRQTFQRRASEVPSAAVRAEGSRTDKAFYSPQRGSSSRQVAFEDEGFEESNNYNLGLSPARGTERKKTQMDAVQISKSAVRRRMNDVHEADEEDEASSSASFERNRHREKMPVSAGRGQRPSMFESERDADVNRKRKSVAVEQDDYEEVASDAPRFASPREPIHRDADFEPIQTKSSSRMRDERSNGTVRTGPPPASKSPSVQMSTPSAASSSHRADRNRRVSVTDARPAPGARHNNALTSAASVSRASTRQPNLNSNLSRQNSFEESNQDAIRRSRQAGSRREEDYDHLEEPSKPRGDRGGTVGQKWDFEDDGDEVSEPAVAKPFTKRLATVGSSGASPGVRLPTAGATRASAYIEEEDEDEETDGVSAQRPARGHRDQTQETVQPRQEISSGRNESKGKERIIPAHNIDSRQEAVAVRRSNFREEAKQAKLLPIVDDDYEDRHEVENYNQYDAGDTDDVPNMPDEEVDDQASGEDPLVKSATKPLSKQGQKSTDGQPSKQGQKSTNGHGRKPVTVNRTTDTEANPDVADQDDMPVVEHESEHSKGSDSVGTGDRQNSMAKKPSSKTEEGETVAPKGKKGGKADKKVVIELPQEDDADPDAPRKSSRNRVKPVEYWRNERIKYELRKSISHGDILPVVKEVIHVPKVEETDHGHKRRKTYHKSHPRASSADVETVPLESPDILVVNHLTGAEETQRIVCIPEMWDPQLVGNGGYLFQRVFSIGEYCGTGLLVLPPDAEKPNKNTSKTVVLFQKIFCVLEGKVQVHVHKSIFEVGVGAHFVIPRANQYSIRNTYKGESRLLFTQVREQVESEVQGTDPGATQEAAQLESGSNSESAPRSKSVEKEPALSKSGASNETQKGGRPKKGFAKGKETVVEEVPQIVVEIPSNGRAKRTKAALSSTRANEEDKTAEEGDSSSNDAKRSKRRRT